MSTQTTAGVGTPVFPAVNLMPPEIEEARRFRRAQAGMGLAVAAAAGVVGVLYLSAGHGVSAAQSQVAAAQQQHTALVHQLGSLQYVDDVYNQVSQRQQMLSTAMGQEVRWSRFLNDITLRIPDNVWLTGLQATENLGTGTGTIPGTGVATPAAAGSGPSSGGVLDSGLGTITFTGFGTAHDDVASWLDALAKEKGFENPYFSSSTQVSPSRVQFTSTVTIDQAALSHRYDPAGS